MMPFNGVVAVPDVEYSQLLVPGPAANHVGCGIYDNWIPGYKFRWHGKGHSHMAEGPLPA